MNIDEKILKIENMTSEQKIENAFSCGEAVKAKVNRPAITNLARKIMQAQRSNTEENKNIIISSILVLLGFGKIEGKFLYHIILDFEGNKEVVQAFLNALI